MSDRTLENNHILNTCTSTTYTSNTSIFPISEQYFNKEILPTIKNSINYCYKSFQIPQGTFDNALYYKVILVDPPNLNQ